MQNACHVIQWFCQSKPVCKADWYLESLLAGKVPGGPDRERALSDQAFYIQRLFPGMQPQKMAADLEGDRKINLMDMFAFLLLERDLSCYVGAEIKQDEPRPYLMCYHLPAL